VYNLPDIESISPQASYPSPQGSLYEDARALNFPNIPPFSPICLASEIISVEQNWPADAGGSTAMQDVPESSTVDPTNGPESVSVSTCNAPVPEPSSWGLIGVEPQSNHDLSILRPKLTHKDDHVPRTFSSGPQALEPLEHIRLQSDMLEMLQECDPGSYDIVAMQDIVALTKSVWESNEEHLEKAYGCDFQKFKATLIRWLEVMNGLITIRSITCEGFSGDSMAREAYLDSLSEEDYAKAVKSLYVTKKKVSEWRGAFSSTVEEFSRDSTSMFLGLIQWKPMRRSYVEKLLVAFNKKLLAWF
jgi:hypothetical protein